MAKIQIKHDSGYKYECPECRNEEIELGQNYCQICGEVLEWQEENSMTEDYYNRVRKEMESAGIVESDIVAAISIT